MKSAEVAWRRFGAAVFAVAALVVLVVVVLVVAWREEAWARVARAGADFCAMRAGRELRAMSCEVRTGAMRAAGRDSGRVG